MSNEVRFCPFCGFAAPTLNDDGSVRCCCGSTAPNVGIWNMRSMELNKTIKQEIDIQPDESATDEALSGIKSEISWLKRIMVMLIGWLVFLSFGMIYGVR